MEAFAKTINHDGRYGVQFMVPITEVTDLGADHYNTVKDNYEDKITISVQGLVPEIQTIMFTAEFEIEKQMTNF